MRFAGAAHSVAGLALSVFSLLLLAGCSGQRLYQATATVQLVQNPIPVVPDENGFVAPRKYSLDLNTVVKLLESSTIIQNVSARLTGDDLRRFMAPYETSKSGSVASLVTILGENRRIVPQPTALQLRVQYRHPDRLLAAKVANLFADEFIAYQLHTQIERSLNEIAELQTRADLQFKKVQTIAVHYQEIREIYGMGGIDQKERLTHELADLNTRAPAAQAKLNEAEDRWKQVKNAVAANNDLVALPSVSSNPAVNSRAKEVAAKKTEIAQLANRYHSEDPAMIAATQALAQAEAELAKATQNAVASIEAQYHEALRENQDANLEKEQVATELAELAQAEAQYNELQRSLDVEEKIYQDILTKIQDAKLHPLPRATEVRIIARAVPPAEGDFVSSGFHW